MLWDLQKYRLYACVRPECGLATIHHHKCKMLKQKGNQPKWRLEIHPVLYLLVQKMKLDEHRRKECWFENLFNWKFLNVGVLSLSSSRLSEAHPQTILSRRGFWRNSSSLMYPCLPGHNFTYTITWLINPHINKTPNREAGIVSFSTIFLILCLWEFPHGHKHFCRLHILRLSWSLISSHWLRKWSSTHEEINISYLAEQSAANWGFRYECHTFCLKDIPVSLSLSLTSGMVYNEAVQTQSRLAFLHPCQQSSVMYPKLPEIQVEKYMF